MSIQFLYTLKIELNQTCVYSIITFIMGITGLRKFLESNIPLHILNKSIVVFENEKPNESLRGKTVVIDTSIFIHQYATAVIGTPSEHITSTGRTAVHLQAILSKVFSYVSKGLKPIFVFDGKPPAAKKKTIQKRENGRSACSKEQIKLINRANEVTAELSTIDSDSIESYAENVEQINYLGTQIVELSVANEILGKRTFHVTRQQITEVKSLLSLLGIPYVQAPEEADPQCAHLVKNGIGDFVASDDMDLLTFGTPCLITSLKTSGVARQFNLETIVKSLDITFDQFIEVCILLGCDYTCTIRGLGPKRILPMIKEYGSIENLIETCPFIGKQFIIQDDFEYELALECFKNPNVIDVNVNDIVWKVPQYNNIREILESYEFDPSKVNEVLGKLSNEQYEALSDDSQVTQYNTQLKAQMIHKYFDSDSDTD